MKQELLLIEGAFTDLGLRCKALELAEKGNLSFRIISVARLEESTADDLLIANELNSKIENARVILASATVRLRAILPILAFKLQAGLTADCTYLDITQDGKLMQTSPAFGNSLIADIETVSAVQMATVRPKTFPITKNIDDIIAEELVSKGSSLVNLINFSPITDTYSITDAKIIVAGGAGIGSKEGFKKLNSFAKLIGGVIAASRKAVDAGFSPYSTQVGMTGVTVSPKLYIAVGISGAVQHLAGMSAAQYVRNL